MNKKSILQEIADIQIGYQFRGKLIPVINGNYRVIQLKDINDANGLDLSGLFEIYIEHDLERYQVTKGDVLFLSKGNHNYALPITEILENTIAVSYFFIIRIKTDIILPEYLAWYINQAPVQINIKKYARQGSRVSIVPKSVFNSILIEIPALKTQKMIVELDELQKHEKYLLEEIVDKRKVLINTVCLRATENK